MQTIDISLDDIDTSNRLRHVDMIVAAGIAASFEERGQLQPIAVRPVPGAQPFRLIAGAHRYEAARLVGWSTLQAVLHENISDAEARLFEIDENLVRSGLTAIERVVFLAERKKAWEEAYPQTKHGGDRKSLARTGKNQVAMFATWSKEAAEKFGCADRSVRHAVTIAERLSPEVIDLARTTYLFDHLRDLAELSTYEPAEQLAAVQKIAAGEARRVREAVLGRRDAAAADPVTKLMDGFNRLKKAEQNRFLRLIGATRSDTRTARRAADEAA